MSCQGISDVGIPPTVLVHFRVVQESPTRTGIPQHYLSVNSTTALLQHPRLATLVDFTSTATTIIDNDEFGIRTRAVGAIGHRTISSVDMGELFVQWNESHDRLPLTWIRNDDELKVALRMMKARGWRDHFCLEIKVNLDE